VSVAAAILAIVISLIVAAGLSDVTQTGATGTPAPVATPAPQIVPQTAALWARSPFVPLLSAPLPDPWTTTLPRFVSP
jgi:hypothetical protein